LIEGFSQGLGKRAPLRGKKYKKDNYFTEEEKRKVNANSVT